MRTGAWTAALLLLAILTGTALPADASPVSGTNFTIPIKIDPARAAEIQGVELYVSTDQGRNWNQKGYTTPDRKEFNFTADVDGEYWFSILIVDRNNRREPPHPNAAPVGQKLLVDTLKPEVKLRAERQGDSVNVNWEIHEEHPNLNSFRLEWRPADGPENWVAVQTSPGMTGQTSIKASEAIVVRGSLEDTAHNQGKDEARVPAAAGSVAAAGPGLGAPVAPAALPASESPASTPTPIDTAVRRVSTSPPATKVGLSGAGSEEMTLPAPPAPSPTPTPAPPALPPAPDHIKMESIAVSPPPVAPVSPLPPPVTAPPSEKTPSGVSGSSPSVLPPVGPSMAPPPAAGSSKTDLHVINTKRVTMEYKVSKVGPSGVGSVDVYLTRDDGMNWKLTNAEHQAVGGSNVAGVMRRTVSVDLAEDGIYGFYLVARSGAGISKPAPRAGLDVPQWRVKLDTTPPVASLMRPRKDKVHPDALFITWAATDANLTDMPVTIQWAEKPSGPWENIGSPQMANVISDASQIIPSSADDRSPPPTGSYTWHLPANIPPNVYLRLTVRDAGGNVAIAETKEPISIDLSEPDVEIIGSPLGVQSR
jgi:hypothetical protein